MYSVTFDGEAMNLRELSDRTGLHYQTIRRWHATGKLTAAHIERALRLRELRETAVRNNVDLHAARIRRYRGWSERESYTVPHYGRRNTKERLSA